MSKQQKEQNHVILEMTDISHFIIDKAYSLKKLKALGINPIVSNIANHSKFIDLENEKYNPQGFYSKKDIALFVDLYVGTILNNLHKLDFDKEKLLCIPLPGEMMQLSILYNLYAYTILWRGQYYHSYIYSNNTMYLFFNCEEETNCTIKNLIKITD